MTLGRKTVVTLSLISLALGACRKDKKTEASPANVVDEGVLDDARSGDDALPQTEEETATLLETCRGAGKDAGVASIAEAVSLINLLPKPVSIPCFMAALPRTFAIAAAESIASAQPASREKPRFFLALDGLFITVTSDGVGKNHVELSDFDGRRQSVKGDLLFPIEGEIDAAAPFAFKVEGQESSCATCHGGEKGGPKDVRDSTLSDAIRPAPDALLAAEEVSAIREACTSGLDAHCVLVRSVFFDATPQPLIFPVSMKVSNGKPPKTPEE